MELGKGFYLFVKFGKFGVKFFAVKFVKKDFYSVLRLLLNSFLFSLSQTRLVWLEANDIWSFHRSKGSFKNILTFDGIGRVFQKKRNKIRDGLAS